MVRRFLSSYARELAGKIEAIDETALLVDVQQALPLADFSAGITLPANRYVAGVTATPVGETEGRTIPVELIPWGQRNSYNTKVASAWIVNTKLYLNGLATWWNNVASLAISYAPIMAELVTDDDAILLPDTADLVLTEAVALFMARRGHNDPRLPAIDVGMFAAVAGSAETAFLDDIRNRVAGEHFRVVDVWSPS